MIAKIIKGSNFKGVVSYIFVLESSSVTACLSRIRKPSRAVLKRRQG